MASTDPNDPVIAYHDVGFHRFEMSCLRTRSIRDQIVRTQLLVERLVSRNILRKDDRPLLVIGGGAAGLSAAFAAINLGIDTTLVEIEPTPISRQLGINTRRLHPCEYDWPHGHWRNKDMGPPGSFALDFVEDTAEGLATRWLTTLDKIMTGVVVPPATLDLYLGIDARDEDQLEINEDAAVDSFGKGMLVAESPDPRWGAPKAFGAAISCIGFSGEKTAIPAPTGEVVGPKYWSKDKLEDIHLGLGPPATRGAKHRVLVSGAGDGAQQDFLRALTGSFGLDLAKRLGFTDPMLVPEITQATLEEDFALRALSLADPLQPPPPLALLRWHKAYEKVVAEVWRKWVATGEVRQHLSCIKPDIEATWVLGGPCLSYSFALNRVLALLVARLHANVSRRPVSATGDEIRAGKNTNAVIVTDSKVLQATPVGGSHTCGAHCNGQAHTVELSLPGGASLPLGAFDVFVVRHGVDQDPYFAFPPVHEQRVPFFRPA